MLKTKINKDAYDALPDELKAHYKEQNGNYILVTDEAEELRTGAAKAREERDAANRKLEETTAQIEALNEKINKIEKEKKDAADAAARQKNDIPALEASWQAKLDEANAEAEKKVTKLTEQLQKLLIDNKAIEIANEISISPKLLIPHIKPRLSAELGTDNPITRVLDADGRPSALSLDDLKKEFVANEDFAAIIKGSSANGGGAAGGANGGGAAGKKISEMSEAERSALARENPAKFRELAKAEGITLN